MLIAIIGGRLQGTEIAYLAREAGHRTVLVDRDPKSPASGLVDDFRAFDIADGDQLHDVVAAADIVFPAIEDIETLGILEAAAARADTPIMLDLQSYRVSASKLRSNELFVRLDIPTPPSYPNCGFPVIAKPCYGSGSEGVRIFAQRPELDAFLADKQPESWCIQQFIDGPSYSVEIIGQPGDYKALQVTELFMDESFDCMKVAAPATLDPGIEAEFRAKSVAIAEALGLDGIMDVEVIVADGHLYFLEIDARFPSQTPIAVYHSTGINMVKMLVKLFVDGKVANVEDLSIEHATLEHMDFKNGEPHSQGEHIMANCRPLHVRRNFFDSDVAITDYREDADQWVATLINRSGTEL
jgi:pyrrolysine biosynthesis protein PylC